MGYLNNYIVPTAFTIMLHIIVLFTVLVGWQMSDINRYRVDTPRFVKARLVTLEQKLERKVLKKQQRAKPVNKTTPAPAKPVQEPLAMLPPAPAVTNKPTVAVKPKVEPVPVAPAKPDPAIQRQQLRAQAHQQQQRDMLRAMQEEELLMQAEEDQLLADSYAASIKRTVEGYWSRPPSARKDMQVTLSIRLIPTGDVVGVAVTQSSGNRAFDRSALNAVEKAARFPELKGMPVSVFEAYFRRFSLVFKPEDLLL